MSKASRAGVEGTRVEGTQQKRDGRATSATSATITVATTGATNALGGPEPAKWMGGGPNPDGPGTIPDISPSGLGDWSGADIAYFLESGFTPDFDSAGGGMAAVIEETSKLPAEDREAIAAYLKAVPAVD